MLRKNVAGQFLGFAAIKASDGTIMTGTTGFAAYRVIDGGAQAAATGTVTDRGNGQYSFALSQADTNGNDISILFTMTGMIAVEKTFVTTACDPTDAADFGMGNLDVPVSSVASSGSVDVGTWGGTTVGPIPPDCSIIRSGLAQGGSDTTITLDLGASAVDGTYDGEVVVILSGTGAGQNAIITSYIGSTQMATINGSWATAPDDTSGFVLLPLGGSPPVPPFMVNKASGLEVAMVQSSDHVTPYTAGGVTVARDIDGVGPTPAAGTVTQVGATNRYYFAGAAADFAGANVTFTFSASGADPVTITINTVR